MDRQVMPRVETAPRVKSAFARADLWFVHNEWPEWRELTAREFEGMRRKVVVDGRRILRREAMKGIELIVLGG